MSKARSKIKLCIVSILTIIGLLLTFVSFVVPTTSTTFNSFFGAINFGYDIAGGRLTVYEVANEDLTDTVKNERLISTVTRLQSNFSQYGFTFTKHDYTIRVTTSKTDDSEMSKLLSLGGSSYDLQSIIAGENGITFNTSSSEWNADGSITQEYVKSCKLLPSQANGVEDVYPVSIEFTEEGKRLFKEMTTEIANDSQNKKLYMYLNGTVYNSSGFEVTSAQESLELYSTSQGAATSLMIQINALAKPLSLSKVVDDFVTAGLNTGTGEFFGNVQILLIIAILSAFVAGVIYLFVKYKIMGLLGAVSMLLFVSIYAFLLQSIPLVLIDLNGLLGVLLTLGLLYFGMVGIFERVRKEYASGKKIPNSVQSAFRKSVLPVLERYVFLLILSVILYIVGTVALQAFAVALFVGLFVNYFVLFVALRGMSNSYIVVNSTKNSHYNLKREEVKNEI